MGSTIRSIDSVWLERPYDLHKAVEHKLSAWLRGKDNAAVRLLLAFLELCLPLELYELTLKINHSGKMIV